MGLLGGVLVGVLHFVLGGGEGVLQSAGSTQIATPLILSLFHSLRLEDLGFEVVVLLINYLYCHVFGIQLLLFVPEFGFGFVALLDEILDYCHDGPDSGFTSFVLG